VRAATWAERGMQLIVESATAVKLADELKARAARCFAKAVKRAKETGEPLPDRTRFIKD
jgi:hypothetical protein